MLTNVYGHLVLAAELMPLLKTSPGARVVTQSSGARLLKGPGKIADLDGTDAANYNGFDQYCLSKACCVLMTQVGFFLLSLRFVIGKCRNCPFFRVF